MADTSVPPTPSAAKDVRPWVKRLGSYLRIFGVRPIADARTIDKLAQMAQKREYEHGR